MTEETSGAEPSVAASMEPEDLTQIEAAVPAEISVPAWLADAPPAGALAGLLRIELPEGALPWRDTLDESVLRRRAQYMAGVELIAENFGALEPLQWEGDALQLVFGGISASELPGHTFRASKDLWNRVRAELDLPVKLAAHVGRVHSGTAPGLVVGGDVDACKKLATAAPVGTIALSEELTLALPEEASREVTVLGHRPGEERSVYAYPRTAAAEAASGLVIDETARLWGKFRSYATGPDVRLVRYVGFRLQKKEPPRLDILNVFVPSEVEMRRRADADLRKKKAIEEALVPSPWSVPSIDSTGPDDVARDFRDLYARSRSLIVLGDPGSGKTTLLRWLAVIAASGSFKLDAELGVAERLLPVPVSVGRLAEIRRGLGARGEAVSVPAALSRYFHDRSVHEDEVKLRDFLVRELDSGRCLILLDGLDEVKSEERQTIYQWLESFAAEYSQNRFVVSSRVVGYSGFQLPGDVAEGVLRPFTQAQVERYVRAFHLAYVRWETNAEPTDQGEADRLLEALRASPRLSALARNPFMLSALGLIHRAEGKLPRHRVQAYEVFARALCETWAEARRLVAGETRQPIIEYEEEALPILGELALAMHEQYPTGVAPEEFVLRKIAEAFEQQKGVSGAIAKRAALEFLKRAGDEVQILLERGAGEWGFLHLTFQEFFVAAGLHAKDTFESVALQHLFNPRWEEVIRLGVGYLALVQKRPTAAQNFVRKVLFYDEPEPRAWITRLLKKQVPLAALLAAEAGDALPVTLQQQLAVMLASWLAVMPREVSAPILKELMLTDFAPRVADACKPLIHSNNPETRARIASALGALCAASMEDTLLMALTDESTTVGKAAAKSLHNFLTKELMHKVEPLLSNTRSDVRILAIEALTPLGNELSNTPLQQALQDSDDGVRAAALVLLKHRTRTEAAAAIHSAQHDKSPKVKSAISEILVHFMNDREIQLFARDKDTFFRTLIALRVIAYGKPRTETLLTSLLASNEEPKGETRDSINEFISYFVQSSIAKQHTKEQNINNLRSQHSQTRAIAADMLSGSEEALEPLLELANDTDTEVRTSAIRALTSISSDRATEACVKALGDSEVSVREAAAIALAHQKRNEALIISVDSFSRSGPGSRPLFALALGKLGTTEALEPLMTAAQNPQEVYLWAICSAIGDSASIKEAERLAAYLEGHEQPCAYSDHIFLALWTIATREAGRLPEPTG